MVGLDIDDCELLNPLYEDRELRRVFDRGKHPTEQMAEKDETWQQTYRSAFEAALGERIEAGP